MALRTIEKQSSEARATDALRDEILSGRIAPGSRLVEAELAQACGLSRGTIRAALQHLAAGGLVVPSPYRGYSVASLTSRDVWELYTLRNTYESMASRLVAESINDVQRAVIHQAFEHLKEIVQTRNKAAIFESDFNLHRVIIELSGHSRLQDAYVILERQVRLFYILCNEFMTFDDYVTSHVGIIDAITRGDAKVAATLAAEHNTDDGQAVVQKLISMDEAEQAPASSIAQRLRTIADGD